jgi:hypothetical protein
VKELTAQINVQVRKECEDAFNGPNAKVSYSKTFLIYLKFLLNTEFYTKSTFC